MAATPRPWRVEPTDIVTEWGCLAPPNYRGGSVRHFQIVGVDGRRVPIEHSRRETGDDDTNGQAVANADLVVKAVNLHDELVLCCKIARSELTQGTPGGIADALRRLDAVLLEEQRT